LKIKNTIYCSYLYYSLADKGRKERVVCHHNAV
jgi:hypothetical protein